MSLQRHHLLRGISLLCVILAILSLRVASQQNTPQTDAPQPNAQQPNAPGVELDVSYGEVDGQKLLLDVYKPATPGDKRPAVVLVHGGGWAGGNKRDFAGIGQNLARQGFVSFSVGYRLATRTTNKYPAQIDDVQRAVRWIRANAARYGLDPTRIGALGASAGGHLVSLLGTRETRDNSDPELAQYSSKVQCVVDIFGPTDFTIQRPLTTEAMNILVNFIGKTPQEAPEVYREASPIVYVDKNSAPFLIFHGTTDHLVPLEPSQRLHDALRKVNVESTLTVFEGEGNGFREKANIDRFALTTLAFFNRHLKP